MPEFKLVLIVDDDPDDRELFREAVAAIDKTIAVAEATNGEEAFVMLNTGKIQPDYIFMDLNMPRMDGKQCLRKIKASPVLHHIPVIIFTTSKLQVDVEETAKYGVAHFITKPYLFSQLIEAVAFVFQKKWLHS